MQNPWKNLEIILSLSTSMVWEDLGLLNLFLIFKNYLKKKKKKKKW